MMKRYILICAAAALSVMPSAVAADYSPAPASQVEEDIAGKAGSKQPLMELSLDRCLEMALENNMDVLNSRLDVYAAKAQKQEAVAGYFPDVSVNAFTFYAFDPMLELGIKDIIGESEFSNTLQGLIDYAASTYGFDPVYSTLKKGISANVTVLQPVFAGGRIVNGNRLAALGLEAAGLQKNISERNTAEDVEKAYWQVVSLEEKMKTLDRMQALVDTLYKDVSSACAAGLATETDMLQVRLRQNELRSGKISLKNGIRLARMKLFNDTGVRYNPFTYPRPGDDSQMQNRRQSYELGVRAWPWHVFSGWWIAGKAKYEEYNRGGIFSRKTEEGDGFGVGFSAGYSYMLLPSLNLEFGIGFWTGVRKYTVYDCPSCGVTVESGTKGFILPNELLVSFVYVF